MAKQEDYQQERLRMEKLKVFNMLISEREKENLIMQADPVVEESREEECRCPNCGEAIRFTINTKIEVAKK
ncbi:MAG: hypothetical protein N3A57_05630 [Negativicutes bacterium]|nr:hypothetical protein [Negativicutes bacterium]